MHIVFVTFVFSYVTVVCCDTADRVWGGGISLNHNIGLNGSAEEHAARAESLSHRGGMGVIL